MRRHASSVSVRRPQKPSSRHARLVVSALRSLTAHFLAVRPLPQSPRAVDHLASLLLVASPHGVTAWPQRMLAKVPLLHPLLLLPQSLLPQPLPLLLRHHPPNAPATF